jgi:hypothetical protein
LQLQATGEEVHEAWQGDKGLGGGQWERRCFCVLAAVELINRKCPSLIVGKDRTE